MDEYSSKKLISLELNIIIFIKDKNSKNEKSVSETKKQPALAELVSAMGCFLILYVLMLTYSNTFFFENINRKIHRLLSYQ